MNLKWYRIQKDATTTFLHEGEGVDDSPGLDALQEAVGGLIERIPDLFILGRQTSRGWITDSEGVHNLILTVDEQDIYGTLVQAFVHEESKIPLLAITDPDEEKEKELRQAYVAENISPLSFILHPHDFILGDVIVCLKNVEVHEPQPDWMKGMNEEEYAVWAQSWQERSKTHTPSD